jgi:hypothetical protein
LSGLLFPDCIFNERTWDRTGIIQKLLQILSLNFYNKHVKDPLSLVLIDEMEILSNLPKKAQWVLVEMTCP